MGTTVQVQSTEVVAAPTIPVDTPSHAETKQAFAEVSSALHDVSSEQESVHSEMKASSQEMVRMRMECAGEVESTAHVKAVLQQTVSTSSSLEIWIGQAKAEQEQARSTAKVAMEANECALAQALN